MYYNQYRQFRNHAVGLINVNKPLVCSAVSFFY